MAPVNQPKIKLSALKQASGEAVYTDDVPARNCVYAAYVISNVARRVLKSIDPSDALKIEGVIDFVSSKDVPGLNDVSAFTCAPLPKTFKIKPYQPVFVPVGEEVVFAGQPLGLICAVSREIAERAALLVKTTYDDSDEKPILTIEDAIAKKSFYSTDYDDYQHVRNSLFFLVFFLSNKKQKKTVC